MCTGLLKKKKLKTWGNFMCKPKFNYFFLIIMFSKTNISF